MAKITQYQQNRLASAVTDSPTFNNQGVNTLAQAADKGADMAYTAYYNKAIQDPNSGVYKREQQHQAMLQARYDAQHAGDAARQAAAKQAQQAERAAEQLQSAEQDAYLANRVGAADQELTGAYTQTKNQHYMDTDGAANAMQQQAMAVRKSYLDNEKDPLMKAKLDKALASRIASYTDNVSKWAETRQVPIMEDRVKGTAGNFVNTLGNADLSAADIGHKIQQYKQDNTPLYGFIHAPGQAEAQMRDDTEKGIMQWLGATALNAPDKLEPRIASVSGGKLIDPTKLHAFAEQQRAIARDVVKTKAAEDGMRKAAVQLQAGLEIAGASPTGQAKDADPSVYNNVLTKYGADLTPEQQIRFTQQRQQAITEQTKKAETVKTFDAEIKYMHEFGSAANLEVKHAANIQSLILQVTDKKNPDRVKQLPALQNAIDQYQDNMANLQAGVSTITDPSVRKMANLHMVAAKERFGNIVNDLAGSPVGRQTKTAKLALYAQVAPKLTSTDPKANAIYNYFYENSFYDIAAQKGWTPDIMTAISKDRNASQSLRTRLHHEAFILMRDAGLIP